MTSLVKMRGAVRAASSLVQQAAQRAASTVRQGGESAARASSVRATRGEVDGKFGQFTRSVFPKIDPKLGEEEKRTLKFERNTKMGGTIIGAIIVGGLTTFCFYYGRAKRDEHGNVIIDAHTGSWFATFYRIYDGVYSLKSYAFEPSRELLLPDPMAPPYHQPKYTVVIEMKNVLVAPEWSYKTGHRFKKRPALDYFLDTIGYPNFEVVIYTSESALTAQPIVDSMDQKQRIMYRLFRDSTKYMNGHYVKDLSRLNRDLRKVIYIDFDPQAFKLNPENVLRVPKWEGDLNDASLVDLAELLKTIHMTDVEDVRPVLQTYSQFDDPAAEFRRRASEIATSEDKKEEPTSVLRHFAGRLFGAQRHQRT